MIHEKTPKPFKVIVFGSKTIKSNVTDSCPHFGGII